MKVINLELTKCHMSLLNEILWPPAWYDTGEGNFSYLNLQNSEKEIKSLK